MSKLKAFIIQIQSPQSHRDTEKSQNDSTNPFRQHFRIKIDDEADLDFRKSQIGQELSLMNRQNIFDTFEFEDYAITDDEIHAITAIKFNTLVLKGKASLPFIRKSTHAEFITHALFVSRFEKARADVSMDLYGTSDNLLSKLFFVENFLSQKIPRTFRNSTRNSRSTQSHRVTEKNQSLQKHD